MSYDFFKDLSTNQKCAAIGFAVDFCGCEEPTEKQFEEITTLLVNIKHELNVSDEDCQMFITKMYENGKLSYAIEILNTIKNRRFLGSLYPYFYSVVAILRSNKGLAKLDKIFNDEFGYNKDDIRMIWELYEIKDFRKYSNTESSAPLNSTTCFCQHCGKEIDVDSQFCHFCGAAQSKPQQSKPYLIELISKHKTQILLYLLWFFSQFMLLISGNGYIDDFWPKVRKPYYYGESYRLDWDIDNYGLASFIFYTFLLPIIIYTTPILIHAIRKLWAKYKKWEDEQTSIYRRR